MNKKIIILGTLLLMLLVFLTGCAESDRVSHNISKEADNFNVERRLVVINNMTDTIEFEMTGLLSINADVEDNQLEITVKEDEETYKKHYVGLSKFTTYIVEDTTGSDISTDKYNLTFNPDMLIPFDVVVR